MSYILDALRKADAERERGAVPRLNTQAQPPRSDDGEPLRAGSRLPWLIAGASLLALLAAIAWFTVGRGPAPSPAPTVAAPQSPTPAVVAEAPRRSPPSLAPSPAGPIELPAAVPPPRIVAAAPRKAPAAADAPAPQPAATAVSSAEPRIVALRELPDDVRRRIPALAVGGSMYSKDVASRMLIVNGQVLHEGDEVAPGLKLEQIRLKAAVLRYQQHRFEINF